MTNISISIVTVVYNAKFDLEKTIKSVQEQNYKNKEFIIVDGDSSDGIQEIIQNYENEISSYISEPDKGIYDAMNKGVKLANGDFVIFMNAGDKFYKKNTLLKCVNLFKNKSICYFGRAQIKKEPYLWVYPNEKFDNKNMDKWLSNNLPNHQAMFFPKHFYRNYNYNLKYKIGSDSDYKFQAHQDCGFVFLDMIICSFELGGISSEFGSFKNAKQILKDSWYISLKHKGVIYALKRQIKILIKYIVSKCFGNEFLKNILEKLRK